VYSIVTKSLWTTILWALICSSTHAQIASELTTINLSSDINVRVPADFGTLLSSDHGIIDIDIASLLSDGTNWLGDIGGADIDAYQDPSDNCGMRMFSVDSTIELPGGTVEPSDLFDDFGTIQFDGSAEGIPGGVNIDAVSRDPASCLIVFSINVATELEGAMYSSGDLIGWAPGVGFSLYRADLFGVDIDGLQLLPDNRMLISTDVDFDFGDVIAFDEDVVEVIPSGVDTVQLVAFSPRDLDSSWISADVDALSAELRRQPGSFRWLAASSTAFENAGSVSITIERVGGTDGSVDLDWSTSSGSAIEGEDYNGASGTLTFNDGDRFFGVSINLIDDALFESDETFTVSLSNPSNDGSLGEPTVATITIIDDENFVFADGFESD